MMKAECAWCGETLGRRPGPDGQVTHGICEDCKNAVLADFYTGNPEVLKKYDVSVSE